MPSPSSEWKTHQDQGTCRVELARCVQRLSAPCSGAGPAPQRLAQTVALTESSLTLVQLPHRAWSHGGEAAPRAQKTDRAAGQLRAECKGTLASGGHSGWLWQERRKQTAVGSSTRRGSAQKTAEESWGLARSQRAVTGAAGTLLEDRPTLRAHSACPLRLRGRGRAP